MLQWMLKDGKKVVPETTAAVNPKAVIEEGMTLEQVRLAMQRLMAEENTNHHQMGQLYNYVVERELAQAAGFKNAADYFRQKMADLSTQTLVTYGVVARNFSEPISVRFGVNCLALLLTYKELTGLTLDPERPGPVPIEVPDKKGVVMTKEFGACSVDDMRRALQRKRKPTSSQPMPQEAHALADQLSAMMTSHFVKGDPVRVMLRNAQGQAVLDITGIPWEKWQKLSEALQALNNATVVKAETKPVEA